MLKLSLRFLGFMLMVGLFVVVERPAKAGVCEDACAAAGVVEGMLCDYFYGPNGMNPDPFADGLCMIGAAIDTSECTSHCPQPLPAQ